MSQSDHLFSCTIYKRYSKGWHEAEMVTSFTLEHKSQIAMRSQTGPAPWGRRVEKMLKLRLMDISCPFSSCGRWFFPLQPLDPASGSVFIHKLVAKKQYLKATRDHPGLPRWVSDENFHLPMQERQEMRVQSLGLKIPWRRK